MNVLFLCTANSCRSILYETMFNHLTPPEMKAYSAGSQPKGTVPPLEHPDLAQGWHLHRGAEQLKAELALIGTL